jgi:hypothetical protein
MSVPAPVPVPEDVTVCITSCGRLDLLARTLKSFRTFHVGGRLLISEDSDDEAVVAQVRRDYPGAEVLTGEGRTGIMRSIDRLYAVVETPFILHLEDDWLFDGAVDFSAAIGLLKKEKHIANVCVRAFDEIREKYRKRSAALAFAGAEFRVMQKDAHPEFFAWSPNPGLISRDLYRAYAPFARVMPDQMSGVMKADGLTQAFLLPGVARHIGHGRNVVDPTMPARPTSRPAKWLRAIKKKLYYAGWRREPF